MKYINGNMIHEKVKIYIPKGDKYCWINSVGSINRYKARATKRLKEYENPETDVDVIMVNNGDFKLTLVRGNLRSQNGRLYVKISSRELNRIVKKDIFIGVLESELLREILKADFIEKGTLPGTYYISEGPYDADPSNVRINKNEGNIGLYKIPFNVGNFKRGNKAGIGNLCISNQGYYSIYLGKLPDFYYYYVDMKSCMNLSTEIAWCNNLRSIGGKQKDAGLYLEAGDRNIVSEYMRGKKYLTVENTTNLLIRPACIPIKDLGIKILDVGEFDVEYFIKANFRDLLLGPDELGWDVWLKKKGDYMINTIKGYGDHYFPRTAEELKDEFNGGKLYHIRISSIQEIYDNQDSIDYNAWLKSIVDGLHDNN